MVILVAPAQLPQAGQVEGRVLDYQTKQPLANAQVKALDTDYVTLTDSEGEYILPLPPGEYTLVMFGSGYTFANRQVTVQAYSPTDVETVELVPLDSVVTAVGSEGGTAVNSDNSTNVIFAPGALDSAKAVRLTVLPVDAHQNDLSALPGPFVDGQMPLGFVLFEPEGVSFNAPVTWTIAYDGDLPVGAYVPCFYWIEDEARWGEPVDGEVVDLGNGEKGLRAVLPHFSAYGFAVPPPPEFQAPEPPENNPDDLTDPRNNRNAPDNEECVGSQINMMSGELCHSIGTMPLPSQSSMPLQVTAKYRSLSMKDAINVTETVGYSGGGFQYLHYSNWRVSIAGRVFSGEGRNISFQWDGRDSNGILVAPGIHRARTSAEWGFFYEYVDCSFPNFPSCRTVALRPIFHSEGSSYHVNIRRADLSPMGLGWFGPYDTLLINRGQTVSILQGDGRTLTFSAIPGGGYWSPRGDFSVLTRLEDNSWKRTFNDGSALHFNADGRLTQIRDRYGNMQQIYYEFNGQVIPQGSWGLTSRIRRIVSGDSHFDFAYGPNGWVSTITDSSGRVYSYEHDSAGYLTAFIDPLGQQESYTYDARGMMTSYTDKRGFVTNYQLDDDGRVIDRAWPTGTNLQVEYGNREMGVQFDNDTFITTTLDYDYNPVLRMNGVFTVATIYNNQMLPGANSHSLVTTFYDASGNVIETLAGTVTRLEYEGTYEQVSREIGSDGTDNSYTYDAQGNLLATTNALGHTTLMTYNGNGRPLTMTDPLGNQTTLTYDQYGHLASLSDALGHTWQIGYNAAGNPVQMTDASGRVVNLTYDALNRLTETRDALNGVTSQTYDANGNLIQVTDPSGRPIQYQYDSLNRLTRITYADGSSETYAYDGMGNVTTLTDARGRTTHWQYDGANRVTQMTTQSGSQITYTYDSLSQLTSVSDGVLQMNTAYLTGTLNYPLRDSQLSAVLPLSVTTDYGYSRGLIGSVGPNLPVDNSFDPDSLQIDTPVTLGAFPEVTPVTNLPPVLEDGDPLTCDVTLPEIIDTSQTLWPLHDDTVYCLHPSSTILAGVTITVPAGVQLATTPIYQGPSPLVIEGTLKLIGEANNPAILTSVNNNSDYHTYRLLISGNGHLLMQHAEMRFAMGNQLEFTEQSSGIIEDSFVGRRGDGLALRIRNEASVEIARSYIGDLPYENLWTRFSYGIHIDYDAVGDFAISDSYIFFNESDSLWVKINHVAALVSGGNSFVRLSDSPAIIDVYHMSWDDGLLEDTFWAGMDQSPGLAGIRLNSNLHIGNESTLTIEGPWRIEGPPIAVGHYEGQSGNLRLLGQADAPIYLAYGPHWWQGSGIQAHSGSSVEAHYVNLAGPITLESASIITLTHSDVYSGNIGIEIRGSSQAFISDSRIYNNNIQGIKGVDDYEAGSVPVISVTNTAVFGHHDYWGAAAVRIYAHNAPGVGPGVWLYDNVANFIELAQVNITEDVTIPPALSGAYRIDYFDIANSATVTLETGVQLYASQHGGGITIGREDTGPGRLAINEGVGLYGVYLGVGVWEATGHLVVNGTAERPVLLDGGSISSFMGGPDSTIEINYALIENSPGTPIDLNAWGHDAHIPDLTIRNSVIRNNQGEGILFHGRPNNNILIENTIISGNSRWGLSIENQPTVVIRYNAIVDNGSGALSAGWWGTYVDARFNYWGASDGPYYPAGQNDGGGGLIEGFYDGGNIQPSVAFKPWSAGMLLPSDGRLSGIRLTSNENPPQEERYSYDLLGQRVSLNSTGYTAYTLLYTYDEAGRLVARTGEGGGATTNSYGYDAANRLTDIQASGLAGNILGLSYTYDGVSNITQIVSSRDGTSDYSYDGLDRLTGITSPLLTEAYSYDPAGNRLSAGSLTYTYDAAGRLTGRSDGMTYQYDTAGNLLNQTKSGQTTSYTWDDLGRLVRIDYPDSTHSAYAYDYEHRRISKRKPDGSTTYYVYNDLNLMQELDENGVIIASYTYDGLDQPVSMWRDGQTYYYVLDHIGTVLGLVDEGGNLVANYQYDPWGYTLGDDAQIENPFRFVAREYDEESGLYYYRARYYDPRDGRFISRDPMGIDGGLNLYAYVYNNPVNSTDPLGLFCTGGSFYKGFGAGVTICQTSEGTSLCVEAGVGHSSELKIDPLGKLAKNGLELGWKAEAGYFTGGLSVSTGECGVTSNTLLGLKYKFVKVEANNGKWSPKLVIGNTTIGMDGLTFSSPVQVKAYTKVCRRW